VGTSFGERKPVEKITEEQGGLIFGVALHLIIIDLVFLTVNFKFPCCKCLCRQ